MNVLADASLPGLMAAFPEPFKLTLYHNHEELNDLLANQDVLLCRSTLKVNASLLKNHPLRYVATASSGTDHLDYSFLNNQQITVLDAKGCNAISVADYIIASLAYLEHTCLMTIRTVGIIGMGRVGSQVYQRLQHLNKIIYTYDPLKALNDSQYSTGTMEALYTCDMICIHAELHNSLPYSTVNLINEHILTRLKPDSVILNAARGGIVDEEALLKQSQLIYCTDVYLNEPAVDPRIIDKATLCTPHIAGHSLEAKFAAVSLVSKQLHQLIGKPIPEFSSPDQPELRHWQPQKSWQEQILALYNPIGETQSLKQAKNKQAAFTRLREEHLRHDLPQYFSENPIKSIPGHTGV